MNAACSENAKRLKEKHGKKKCQEDNCDNPAVAGGYCEKHGATKRAASAKSKNKDKSAEPDGDSEKEDNNYDEKSYYVY